VHGQRKLFVWNPKQRAQKNVKGKKNGALFQNKKNIPVPSKNKKRAMETDFARRGFVVIEPSWLKEKLLDIQSELRSTIRSFPDFRPQNGVWGVRRDGVLTNPGGFHNLLSRQLRQCATSEIAPIIVDVLQKRPDFDMQCVLAPLSVSHAAHRPKDHARYKRSPFDPQEIVLVGFANIGLTTQSFTCAPGTHVVQASAGDKPVEVYRQLHTEPPRSQTQTRNQTPNQTQIARIPKAKDCQRSNSCDGGAVKIKIRPGMMVVYHTTLLVLSLIHISEPTRQP
jgi:hypothetical protein